MSDKSAIEWTDATWNPITGCTKISPGCDNCYAERFSERWRGIKGHHFEQGFDLRVHWKRFDQPMKWKKPRRIFVNSMSDLFHGHIPANTIYHILDVMLRANHHTYQILTKRPGKMRRIMTEWYSARGLPSHIWLGVSVENQQMAEKRIPDLIKVNSRCRFLSVEPLLERVDLRKFLRTGKIHWVIVGGESGPGARKMYEEWVAEIYLACYDYGVPFFFKQWGGTRPKANGRTFRGQTWDEMPAPAKISEYADII